MQMQCWRVSINWITVQNSPSESSSEITRSVFRVFKTTTITFRYSWFCYTVPSIYALSQVVGWACSSSVHSLVHAGAVLSDDESWVGSATPWLLCWWVRGDLALRLCSICLWQTTGFRCTCMSAASSDATAAPESLLNAWSLLFPFPH